MRSYKRTRDSNEDCTEQEDRMKPLERSPHLIRRRPRMKQSLPMRRTDRSLKRSLRLHADENDTRRRPIHDTTSQPILPRLPTVDPTIDDEAHE